MSVVDVVLLTMTVAALVLVLLLVLAALFMWRGRRQVAFDSEGGVS